MRVVRNYGSTTLLPEPGIKTKGKAQPRKPFEKEERGGDAKKNGLYTTLLP